MLSLARKFVMFGVLPVPLMVTLLPPLDPDKTRLQGLESSFLDYQCTTRCLQTRYITIRGMRGAAGMIGQRTICEPHCARRRNSSSQLAERGQG